MSLSRTSPLMDITDGQRTLGSDTATSRQWRQTRRGILSSQELLPSQRTSAAALSPARGAGIFSSWNSETNLDRFSYRARMATSALFYLGRENVKKDTFKLRRGAVPTRR